MASLLQNTYNTRYLLSHDIPLIRSDVPMKMTEDEKQINAQVSKLFYIKIKLKTMPIPANLGVEVASHSS